MSMNPRLLRPTASGFNPRSISGLALWLDASDSSTLFQNSDGTVPATATSDPVGYWADKSGNGRHAVQATASLRPTLGTLGAKNALSFAGNAIATQSYAAKATSTYVYVGRHDETADTFFQTGPTNGFHSHLVELTSKFRRNEAAAKGVVLGTNVGLGVDSLWCVDFSNDSISVRHNGVTYGATSTASETTISDSSRATTLGMLAAIETYAQLKGRIAEFIVYGGRNLKASERGRLERSLAAKYGITLAPTVSNADAQNWIDRVYQNGGSVSSATAQAVDTFCSAIQAAGIRSKMLRLNLFCGTGLNACLTPLYRAASLGDTQLGNATDTNVGPFVSGDYVESAGLAGTGNNGIGAGNSKHLRTGLTPATVGFSSGHLSAFIFGLNQTAPSQSGIIAVRDNGSSQRWWLDYRQASIVSEYTGNNFTTFAPPASSTNSHIILSRTSLSSMRYFQNGAQVGSEFTTSVSGAGGTADWPVFATLVDGSPTSYAPFRMGGYSIGIGMTPTQAASYTTAMQEFQTAMSRS